MTLNYGLIGSGMMGQEHIRNIKLLPGARVAAIADPDLAMARAAQDMAGPDCASYQSHADMLAAGGLDAIVVAAPNHLHLPILRDVLKTDFPVLCEKPLATNAADAREMADLARAKGLIGMGNLS